MNVAKLNQIKALIATTGSRFISVEFTKIDGSERQMLVNPARMGSILRKDTSEKSASHVQGAATRKVNNPHLLNVWDEIAGGPRSINLATVSKLKIDGVLYQIAG